jgi:putative ABC transport system permease protein
MNSWFFYFLKKALALRKGRFIISVAAVTLAVTIVSALITLSIGIREKIGKELRQYGANMIVTNKQGGLIDKDVADSVVDLSDAINHYQYQLYGTIGIEGNLYEIIGIEMEKLGGIRVQGRISESDHEIMIGVNLKELLKVEIGDDLRFDKDGSIYKVSAYFERGTDEDSAILMPIEDLMRLLGVKGISAILLNVDSPYMKNVESLISSKFKYLIPKTLNQVAVTEKQMLSKIQLLMLIVTAVILLSSVIALGSTMGANVIERMEEIGLMKAIGATSNDIRNYFISESALAGAVGAVIGYVIGMGIAELVSYSAFGSFISINPVLIPVSLFVGMFIAVISTYMPVKDAMSVVPAAILRGE